MKEMAVDGKDCWVRFGLDAQESESNISTYLKSDLRRSRQKGTRGLLVQTYVALPLSSGGQLP